MLLGTNVVTAGEGQERVGVNLYRGIRRNRQHLVRAVIHILPGHIKLVLGSDSIRSAQMDPLVTPKQAG